MQVDPEIIDTAAVAKLLGVSERTVKRRVSRRLIPHTKLPGRLVRFEKRRVLEWFRGGCRKPQASHLYRRRKST